MMKIADVYAYEVLDSRGNPTVKAVVELESGIKGEAYVPSGASTGSKEALELRDGDKDRFSGKGVLKACEHVNTVIRDAVLGMDAAKQQELDQRMLLLDGTPNKEKLGANAILSVSLAAARAAAKALEIPLWNHLQKTYGLSERITSLPIPMMNVINGGAHSDSGFDIQEYMVVPSGIESFSEKVRACSEIYAALKSVLQSRGHRIAVGDEGGFAPQATSNEEPLVMISEAIKKTEYVLGEHVYLGMDAAASEFYDEKSGKYLLKCDNLSLSNEELAEKFNTWRVSHKMEVIEDPMSESDWEGWRLFNRLSGSEAAVIGDDLTTTNAAIVDEAAKQQAINTVLIKVNQIGSLTETMDCIATARRHGMKISVSHRSGETTDDFIADLAVATKAEYVKFGAPARGERVAKYNRIIDIEHELHR